ncbi:MAG: KdsC family phosphatase [Oscillospiraceae bacterium]
MDIRLIVIDVDGTMTDGGIYYDENGNEMKKFCTKDAAGFFAARQLGITTMVLTGRKCAATSRRMAELKIDHVYQDVKNKVGFLTKFMEENGITKEQLVYIGDDINDLSPMKIAGFVGCPADSCAEVLEIADYVSKKNGGEGAVRDVIEHILRKDGLWEQAIYQVYGIGI